MAETELIGTVLDGRYKVIEPIAEGAMGGVYRGERVGLGRAVAIKVMHQELPDELSSRQRFEREAKLMALLEHPNCVSVIDFGLHDDKPYLVMDLVRGTSLLQLLDEVGRLEPVQACDIIRQVLAGLAHAHELGIIHRDVKPANIMISEKAGVGQQVRILDFGLARPTESSTKLTTGIVVGTPNYMSPEQCKGGNIDARTDLYACGVMLFEMLTGRKPFVADDPIQVVRKHLLEKPPTLASVVPNVEFGDLESVVAKALSKSPGDRYPSAVEMAKAVEAAATKASKTSAAALYARAVPEGVTVPSQQATPSGWNVPPEAQASIPLSDSAILPLSTEMPALQPGAIPPPVSPAAPQASSPPPPPPSAPASGQAASSVPAAPPSPVPPDATVQAPPLAAPGSDGTAPIVDGAATVQGAPPSPDATVQAPPPDAPSDGAATVQTASVDAAATVQAVPVVDATATVVDGAAPNGALVVPPTRPSTTAHPSRGDRPIPQLPLTKKQLLVAAAGVAGLFVVVLVAAGGGDNKAGKASPVGSAAVAATTSEPKDDTIAAVVERANQLIEAQSYEQAVATLRRARKAHPDNAELAFLSGKANFGRYWWSDGIADFRKAIEIDSSYRENPELLKTVLRGFITTPRVDERIVGFMREIGPPFRPYLEETAETHPRKVIRDRARAELNARP